MLPLSDVKVTATIYATAGEDSPKGRTWTSSLRANPVKTICKNTKSKNTTLIHVISWGRARGKVKSKTKVKEKSKKNTDTQKLTAKLLHNAKQKMQKTKGKGMQDPSIEASEDEGPCQTPKMKEVF